MKAKYGYVHCAARIPSFDLIATKKLVIMRSESPAFARQKKKKMCIREAKWVIDDKTVFFDIVYLKKYDKPTKSDDKMRIL